jgi:hypothetical protein
MEFLVEPGSDEVLESGGIITTSGIRPSLELQNN